MFRQRLPDWKPDHGEVRAIRTHVTQDPSYQLVGVGAVEVVGVDHRERFADDGLRRQRRVTRSPWRPPARGHKKPFRESDKFLPDEGEVDPRSPSRPEPVSEQGFDFAADHEDDAAESGPQGIVDGVIEDGFAGRPDRPRPASDLRSGCPDRRP